MTMARANGEAREKLGPAERIIQTALAYTDHLYHGRPGVVVPAPGDPVGVRWSPVTHKLEGAEKVVYQLDKVGKKTRRARLGVLREDGKIAGNGTVVGEYRPAGLFPEVAAWLYRQVAEVWKLDNEFCARWASYAYAQEHRDMKVVLAAFLLVQSRKGDPVLDGGKVAFLDEDYRGVGEAMVLLARKDGRDLNPKLVARVEDLLKLPGVAAINRELGFGRSARAPFLGRYDKVVRSWLGHREQNPQMLEGLVKAGFRTTVMDLASRVHYRPETPRFYEILRWKQSQAEDGRRRIAVGKEVRAAETWAGLDERGVCERIIRDRPDWKRVVGLLPREVGLTRAVVAAAIEAGSLSDKDLVILSPTLEELGLLEVQDVRERWERAVRAADDMRAANVAARVRSQATREKLQEGADAAVQKAVAEISKNIRVYVVVDASGSMERSIATAKLHLARFLQGFPPDRVHVATFNTVGREVRIAHPSAAGVENAFRGIAASGGTDYGAGVRALAHFKPQEDEDAVMIFVGDEQALSFEAAVVVSGLRPLAFGLVRVSDPEHERQFIRTYNIEPAAVRVTARALGIPCFQIDERTFADPYAIPRTMRALIAATPVQAQVASRRAPVRETLVDVILKTELLAKPAWA